MTHQASDEYLRKSKYGTGTKRQREYILDGNTITFKYNAVVKNCYEYHDAVYAHNSKYLTNVASRRDCLLKRHGRLLGGLVMYLVSSLGDQCIQYNEVFRWILEHTVEIL